MAVKIFFCYAREDEALLNILKSHLRPLQRQGLIDVWYDRDIRAGTEWESEIKEYLNTAQIILLLVSPDFMDSDYCYSKEMVHAMKRHDQGEASVIPIILRPCLWFDAPFGKLQALPTNAKPVTSWSQNSPNEIFKHRIDEAFFDIAQDIQKIVEELKVRQKTPTFTSQVALGNSLIYDERKQDKELRGDIGISSQEMTIFGIDLGSTCSCISYADRAGKAIVISNSEGSETTPSVVFFDDNTVVVGQEAKNLALLYPDAVVERVRLHLGDSEWHFVYKEKNYTPEEISSYILHKLALGAQQQIGIEVKDVVITCPAYFTIPQCEAIFRAGRMAGFTVREVLNETTAALIAYSSENKQNQVVLLYNLGGSTFNVSVSEIWNSRITVLASGGDHLLGGQDWNNFIVRYLAEQWKLETGTSENPLDSLETSVDLWLQAERAKIALTTRDSTRVPVTHMGMRVTVTLTRAEFEAMTAPLLDRTIWFTYKTIKDAQERGYQFDQILLIGGATKMIQVVERLKKEFGTPLTVLNSVGTVAMGAALYGHILYIQGEKFGTTIRLVDESMKNAASHSLGIIVTIDPETPRKRKVIVNLIRVNDPLPISRRKIFFTAQDNQNVIKLEIIENMKMTDIVELVDYSLLTKVGNVLLSLPPGLPSQTPIELTFTLNQQGQLHVLGYELHNRAFIEATM